ncbi:Hypothetical_protein [Hexamita inflata]|uniref:Hypothetical_protein n=1 Tax=Hexamita inflata TaxID=28002 RepID=A0AA86NZY7_9EUKA|nr:Hypothetical protein HINF_LOCUS16025 [Hexamita inflata]CAI9942802.1 Hypothetical protein HINF_LOCUS30447 [Hexamita inflata]
MENSDSFALQIQEFDETLHSDGKQQTQLSEEYQVVYQRRVFWCIIAWCSSVMFVLSAIGIYLSIKFINQEYNVWQNLILTQCILFALVSTVGIFFSVRACYKVKSASLICFCKNKSIL